MAKRTGRKRESGHQEPPIQVQEPPIETRESPRRYWPADRPLPSQYVKTRRRLQPCPSCRRVLLDNNGQAAVCTSSGADVVWLRCRACGHRWQLGVKEV